jgi:hypothetical protein
MSRTVNGYPPISTLDGSTVRICEEREQSSDGIGTDHVIVGEAAIRCRDTFFEPLDIAFETPLCRAR